MDSNFSTQNINYIENLNIEQKEIALNTDFIQKKVAMSVIACAGSGKTSTIIAKILYMILILKCDSNHFFITTFTRNAANELKSRLKQYLSDDIVKNITIGTFHSIAYKSVKSYITTDKYMIEDNIEKFLYDFYNILDNINEEYRYVFIDEYQDINLIQENIIEKLYLNNKCKLLVTVGDDQQNIYTFRNTNISYILNFTQKYENSKYYYLNKNYRSQENIITLANIILKYNINKLDKTLIAEKKSKKRNIKITSFANAEEECYYIVNEIKEKFNDNKIKLHDIAIIARNNSSLQKIESQLTLFNIPTYFLETFEDNKYALENIQQIQNRIILSTIHGTKGLEFKNVFILDLNSGIFPSSLCSDIEEERRLLYVAVTRAKNNLILCYTYNKPSQFLFEILQDEKSNDIIDIKQPILSFEKVEINVPDPYAVTEIIKKLELTDYQYIKDNIFNYSEWSISQEKIHEETPKHFMDGFCGKDLIISNIATIFGDFMELFVTRCILKAKNITIDCLDYVLISLSNTKYIIKKLYEDSIKEKIDNIFGTSLLNQSEKYIYSIINYVDKDKDIKGKLDKLTFNRYKNAYSIYCSNINTSLIPFEIFVISTIKSILKGRSSLQFLLNFNDNFFYNKINKTSFDFYKEWLINIENAIILLSKKYNIIEAQFCIRDTQTNIRGIFDLILDDTIIEIKSYSDGIIKLEMVMQVLTYAALAKRQNIEINTIKIYNPIHGNMYTWNISNWTKHDLLIDFLESKINLKN